MSTDVLTKTMVFRDRSEAGRYLAANLADYANHPHVLVLALPRGGVPVAYEVAMALNAPLDVFVVRKLGVPGHEELAMGAIATGGVGVLNNEVVRGLRIPAEVIDHVTQDERRELERRERAFRDDRPWPCIAGRIILLVDDGMATGATMRAAVAALRQQQPLRIVVAVPVAAPEACDALRGDVDEIICAVAPESFGGVGRWYLDFSQTTDEEVRALLQQTAGREHDGLRA